MNQISPGVARLTAITALIGALVVILSQVVTAYSLENELGEVVETVTLLSKHGVITAIFGLVAALAVVFAVATGSRAAAIVVIGMGAAVVLVFLFVDLPDVGDTGMFNAPLAGNIDVTGKASAGLWLELTGGAILILSGIAMATLGESQLRAIGPGGDRAPTGRTGRAINR
ncbi:MAG TPA: hypothetical protein VMF31_02845 [Solirubrobacterales bacterium]|nr:hypothetical protein [Solirubrobacterales bacterium]